MNLSLSVHCVKSHWGQSYVMYVSVDWRVLLHHLRVFLDPVFLLFADLVSDIVHLIVERLLCLRDEFVNSIDSLLQFFHRLSHELEMVHCFWIVHAIFRLHVLFFVPQQIFDHFCTTISFVLLCVASTSVTEIIRFERIWTMCWWTIILLVSIDDFHLVTWSCKTLLSPVEITFEAATFQIRLIMVSIHAKRSLLWLWQIWQIFVFVEVND